MPQAPSRIKVIYIGGIEHNGSTLLGLSLGNHPLIECVGELSQLPRLGWLDSHYCACGQPIKMCPHWYKIHELFNHKVNGKYTIDDLLNFEHEFDRNLSLIRLFKENYIKSTDFHHYSTATYHLYSAIQQVSQKPVIVDTSKRVSRAWALTQMDNIDLRLIQLVRDSRGVSFSSAKPQRAIRRNWWSSAVRWSYINLALDIIRGQQKNLQSTVIRYEDFIYSPGHTVSIIGRVVDEDLSVISRHLVRREPLAVGHIGIGNGFLQGKKKIILEPQENWSKKMTRYRQTGIWVMTLWGMKRYGYQR